MMKKTYYEAISAQIEAGLWHDCMAMFNRAWTLDFYYRLYTLVLRYEPGRTYGYAQRIVDNTQIISQMGGAWREIMPDTIFKAVNSMNKECSL